MVKFGLDSIYKCYIYNNTEKDTKEINDAYDKLCDIFDKTLSFELRNKFRDLIGTYGCGIEERSFKDGFRAAMQLIKEVEVWGQKKY